MLLENQQIVAIQIKRLVNMKKIECISEEGESIQLHLTTVEKTIHYSGGVSSEFILLNYGFQFGGKRELFSKQTGYKMKHLTR